MIDAPGEEALAHLKDLKIWQSALLQSDSLTGLVGCIAAQARGYLETPLLCVIVAKKDDIEKDLAQCLVELKACRWNNQQTGLEETVFDSVTIGDLYRLAKSGAVGESRLYALGECNYSAPSPRSGG